MRRARDDILRSAATYFRGGGGFRTTSMKDVAEAIGIPRSALYYHFGSKSNILHEILMTGIEYSISKVKEIVEYPLSASDRMKLAFRSILQLYSENPAVPFALVFRDDGTNRSRQQRDEYVAKRDEYEGYLRRLVSEGIERGEFRPLNAKIVTIGLLAMLSEFPTWYNPDGELSINDIADIYSDFGLAGLSGDSGRGPFASNPQGASSVLSRTGATK